MVPSPGRIVHVTLTAPTAEMVNRRREDAKSAGNAYGKTHTGFVVHFGNEAQAGDVLPAIVTRVFDGGLINVQVFLDGSDTLWLTSIAERTDADTVPVDGPATWSWPPRS